MKKGAIIGKRQITLALLVCALGAAVWLNMRLAGNGVTLDPTAASSSSRPLGQAQFVDARSDTSGSSEDSGVSVGAPVSDYFTETRQSRAASRDEALELLRSSVNNVKTDDKARAEAEAEIKAIAARIETEGDIEALIKAKGFSDAIAVVSDKDVSVIVKTGSKLLASEVMQIKDVVQSKTDLSAENIKIITAK